MEKKGLWVPCPSQAAPSLQLLNQNGAATRAWGTVQGAETLSDFQDSNVDDVLG